ncbi:MAG TPA: hypothetical protein VFQ22_03030 [Longimicrobiales bacterium]|nr:hypothetical protein [Longimicrobiales bacterium]
MSAPRRAAARRRHRFAAALALAAAGAATGTLLAPAAARAQDSLTVSLAHQQIWRGVHFGRGLTAEVNLDAGLFGHARTTIGRFGVRAGGELVAPLSDVSGARRAGEHYGLRGRAYVCLDGSSCEWAVEAGADALFRPHDPGGNEASAEVVGGLRGLWIQERLGITLVPSTTIRRDLDAFDGWMWELGLANLIGRSDTKVAIAARVRFADYGTWGASPRDFGWHSGELTVGVRQARPLESGPLVSWTWLLEGGGSWAADAIGGSVGFLRLGVGLIR